MAELEVGSWTVGLCTVYLRRRVCGTGYEAVRVKRRRRSMLDNREVMYALESGGIVSHLE
jgi:hypothetical protein